MIQLYVSLIGLKINVQLCIVKNRPVFLFKSGL